MKIKEDFDKDINHRSYDYGEYILSQGKKYQPIFSKLNPPFFYYLFYELTETIKVMYFLG